MKFKNLQQLFSLFNRKERHHLLDHATRGGMEPSPQFLDQIERATGVELDHGRVWMAMDYHLDWLSAVIEILRSVSAGELSISENEVLDREQLADTIAVHKGSNYLDRKDGNKGAILEGNQQDVDLLILGCDAETEHFHLILLEAKMDTSWSNDQLEAKGKRIAQVLPGKKEESEKGDKDKGKAVMELPGKKYRKLVFHMVFADASGRESGKADFGHFPVWAQPDEQSPRKILIGRRDIWPMVKPTRCDRINSQENKYQNWYVEKIKDPS